MSSCRRDGLVALLVGATLSTLSAFVILAERASGCGSSASTVPTACSR